MNGTSNSLDFKTKVDGWSGFECGKTPGINNNTGRLRLWTVDESNLAEGDTNSWANMDWDARKGEPLMDYDDEARKLFKQLNLTDPMDVDKKTESEELWLLNSVYQDPESGAKLFVGGEYAAMEKPVLEEHKIRNIICAKGSAGPLYHYSDPTISYLPWQIASLPRMSQHLNNAEQIFNFLHPVHSYIRSCLERGENVLVHCMAGAHRAGTTGVSYMMQASGLGYEDARKVARAVRPVINPCGQLETLLQRQEEAAKEIKVEEDIS